MPKTEKKGKKQQKKQGRNSQVKGKGKKGAKKAKAQKSLAGNSILVNIAVLISTLLICLVLLEIGLRLFYPQSLSVISWNDDYGPDVEPNRHVVRYDTNSYRRGVFVFNITTNSHGMRDREYDFCSKTKPRYLFLGDSMTFGEGVERPFMDILEEDEEMYAGGIEALNMGYPGADVAYYYQKLKHRGYQYRPDIIFVNLYTGNDFLYEVDLERTQKPGISFDPVVLSCFHNLHICPFVYGNAFKIAHSFKDRPAQQNYDHFYVHHEKIMQSFYEAAFRFRELAEEHDSELIFVIMPTKEAVDDNKYLERLERIHQKRECHLGRYQIRDELIAFFQANKFEFIDLAYPFAQKNINNTFYFEKDTHWNQQGHELAAEVIFKNLEGDRN
ncbi:hypothetical protein GF351_05020 [Candidatus Woesearchaeota archaeon]|nr:hypothetical protein [Candidatus Woesearchaeota archaeon]